MADITDISGQGGILLPGMAANMLPGMPAIPGMPQQRGGIENLLGSLLRGGGQQQAGGGMGGIDPRAIRMLLFQQMNRPAQGPFSAIANPIVAALMARSIGPQIAQQQQQQQDMERMKAVIDIMRSGAATQASQARAGYDRARTTGAEAEAETVAQLTPEERLAGERAKRFIIPKPGEVIRGQQGERNIKLREEGLKLQQENIDLRKRQEKWNQEMDVLNYGQRGTFESGRMERAKMTEEGKNKRTEYVETGREGRFGEQYGLQQEAERGRNLRAADTRTVQRERIAAIGGSPEVQKAKLNLINAQVDRTKQLMQQEQGRDPATVDTLTNLFKMAKEMSRDKAEEFLEKNAAPLVAKLSGGKIKIPFNSWNIFSLGWEYDDVNAPIDSGVSGGGSSAALPTPGQTPVTPGAAPPTVNTPTGTIPPASDARGLRERYLRKKYGEPIGQAPSVYLPQ